VAGLAVLGLVWAAFSLVNEESGAREGASSQERDDRQASGALSPASDRPAAPARLTRCADAASALSAPLAAVAPAMDQWEVHIGAMNKLVTGAITLQQASAFWNQTRVGAQRRIAAFDRALAEQRRQGVECPPPARLKHASPALRTCARQVAADVRALEKARTSIAMWDKHVRDMDMLRMGMLSPQKATQMWLTMWRQGLRELEDYRVAARAARPSGGC
jgi:hypothetical protein